MAEEKDWRKLLGERKWKLCVESKSEGIEIWGKGTTRDVYNTSDGKHLTRYTANKIA